MTPLERYQAMTLAIGGLRALGGADSPLALDTAGGMDGPWHAMSEEDRVRATVHEMRVYRETCNEPEDVRAGV